MDTLMEKIIRYKNGDNEAVQDIIIQMTPLVKKYARKLHCMEYDDALQELYISLIQSIPYLDQEKGEMRCLKYIRLTIEHGYSSLCKKYLSGSKLSIEELDSDKYIDEHCPYSDTVFNAELKQFISKIYDKNQLKGKLIYLSFIRELEDVEIANILNISRQYVNRVKKDLLNEFIRI